MTIDQIIERELLGGRTVALPFVGTLSVVMRSAQFTASVGSAMRPPYRELVLSDLFDVSRSIISILVDYTPSLSSDQATEHYNQWIESSSDYEQGVLLIEGVCRISTSDFAFYAEQSFEQLLVPDTRQAVNLGRMAARAADPATVAATDARRKNGANANARANANASWKAPQRTASKNSTTTTLTLLLIIAAAIYVVYYLFFRN